MSTVPVILFVYNRPGHTQKTLAALSKNSLAHQTPLYIFSDGPATPGDEEKVAQVRQICSQTTGFYSVQLESKTHNVGLSNHIIRGVSQILEQYDRVIVLEDDLDTAPCFIEFMQQALEFYHNKGIFSVSGYHPPFPIPADYPYATYLIHRNNSWGWATWREKWNRVDWQVADYAPFILNRDCCKQFEQAGNDVTMMLHKQQMGIIQSWSIRFNYAAFKAGEPTVYPVQSLVHNRGADGSGTHMRATGKYRQTISDKIPDLPFCPSRVYHAETASLFRKFFHTSVYRTLINHWMLYRYRNQLKHQKSPSDPTAQRR